MSTRIKRLALALPSYVLFAAGGGLVVDSVLGEIRDTGDAVYAAVRFPVFGLAGFLGMWLARRAGVKEKSSSPRLERAFWWMLVALTVAGFAWLLIDFDAPGWRRLGLALVTVGGLGITLIAARAGLLGRRFRLGRAAEPDAEHLRP